jgi:hypothetical protein
VLSKKIRMASHMASRCLCQACCNVDPERREARMHERKLLIQRLCRSDSRGFRRAEDRVAFRKSLA